MLELGPEPTPPSLLWRLQPISGPRAFSMLTAARTQKPFDLWHCRLSKHISGMRPTLCPLWASGQTARLLSCEAQPFEPWFEGAVARGQPPELQPNSLPQGTGTKQRGGENLSWRWDRGTWHQGLVTYQPSLVSSFPPSWRQNCGSCLGWWPLLYEVIMPTGGPFRIPLRCSTNI